MPEIVRLEKAPQPSMDVFSMKRKGTVLGTVCVVSRDQINAQTVTSIVMTDFSWLPKGSTVNHVIIRGSILTSQRNEAVQRMEGDWLMFIDDDMVWEPDA